MGFVRLPAASRGMVTYKHAEKETGHQTGSVGASTSMPTLSPAEEKMVTAFREHQQGAARLTNAEEIRTLVEYSSGYGVLSTNSRQYPGFPTGSVVGFALDDSGYPFFVFSSMSAHTQDIQEDGKMSLTVTANDFKGASEGRAVLIGSVEKLEDKEIQIYRETYFKRHPGAFWIDFGDFSYWRMATVDNIRYIGGFARAGTTAGSEYLASKPDPLASFAGHVMKHMNEDHADSTAAIVMKEVGVPVTDAEIVGMDRLGMTVKANITVTGGGVTKIRVPFPRPVEERKAVKEVIVEMTRAAAA
jgi:putative heme iron utilization protein